jgi:hypothetical protein
METMVRPNYAPTTDSKEPEDLKKLFWKLGSCSRTLNYVLDREFGHTNEVEERAADPLAGGIVQRGHQCGMLWGSALAAGAESYRRYGEGGSAVAAAIMAAQRLVKSFAARTGTVNCREITGCNWRNPFSIVKYMVTGKMARSRQEGGECGSSASQGRAP